MISAKRPYFKEELIKITYLLKRISECRLDKCDYDWLKTALLFRSGQIPSNEIRVHFYKAAQVVINVMVFTIISPVVTT